MKRKKYSSNNPFETEWRKSLDYFSKKYSGWSRRIYDTKSWRNQRCQNCGFKKDKNIIAIKQPADFHNIHKGMEFYWECKYSSHSTSYHIEWIKPHQIQDLLDITKEGKPNIFGYFVIEKRMRANNRAWILKPKTIKKMVNEATLKSWKWKEIEDNAMFELNRFRVWQQYKSKSGGGYDYIWDLKEFIDKYHSC